MNLNFERIGQFILFCRKGQERTQAELAERLNVTPRAVSNWKRGESLSDIVLMPDLAAILRCTADGAIAQSPLHGIFP